MPRIKYEDLRFGADATLKLVRANQIITDYQAQGYEITLRQLYYQFVSRGWIANSDREYKNLGTTISRGRLAGLVDWNGIIDRTRNLKALPHWRNPSSIIDSAAVGYRTNWWRGQDEYVEVWVEKDALVGVVARACDVFDVPYFSCRGYTSQSEMWAAGRRLRQQAIYESKVVTIIHLGDHDPSGIDMTRDIGKRLSQFAQDEVEVVRIALNRDQIDLYQPPPNPAKETDSRAADYIAEHGGQSWELDALEPFVLDELISEEITKHLDLNLFNDCKEEDENDRKILSAVVDNWPEIQKIYEERWSRSTTEEEQDAELE